MLPKDAKRILNFPGYYATPGGDIWSGPNSRFSNYRKLSPVPRLTKVMYLEISLHKNKKSYSRLIHRLVLETFAGPRPNGMECRHKNGNSVDNRLENLCWGTRQENMEDLRIHNGSHNRAKLNLLQVRIIRRLLKVSSLTQVEIGAIFGVNDVSISNIKLGKTWNYKN